MEQFNNQYQELYHEGIIGQKWGRRHGPPYPLSASQMTATQRKKNKVSEFAKKRTDKESVKQAKLRAKIRVQKAQIKSKEKQEELKKLQQENKDFKKNTKAKVEAEEKKGKVVAKLEGVKSNIDAKTQAIKDDPNNARTILATKTSKTMSDADVKRLATRLSQEDTIERLTSTGKYTPKTFTQKLKDAAIDSAQQAIIDIGKKYVSKTLTDIFSSDNSNTAQKKINSDPKQNNKSESETKISKKIKVTSFSKAANKSSNKSSNIPHFDAEYVTTPFYGDATTSTPGTGLVVRRKRDY